VLLISVKDGMKERPSQETWPSGYEGNGYCWEGHITQLLEQLDPELLDHIEFDPEAGAFFAYADSKASMERFVNLLSPIFSDLTKLATYVEAADRDRVDD